MWEAGWGAYIGGGQAIVGDVSEHRCHRIPQEHKAHCINVRSCTSTANVSPSTLEPIPKVLRPCPRQTPVSNSVMALAFKSQT